MNQRGRLFMLQGGSEESSAAVECNLGVEFGVQNFCRGPSLKQGNPLKRFLCLECPFERALDKVVDAFRLGAMLCPWLLTQPRNSGVRIGG